LLIPTVVCAATMLAVHAFANGQKWLLQLVVIGVVGVAVYVPTLLALALTPEERVALSNGLAKIRGRSTAG
jgi:hypothetical protein